jgi:hypothetical protein
MSITAAEQSKAWSVFASSNTGIIASNPIRGICASLLLFLFSVLCR